MKREKMTAGEKIANEFASGGDWGVQQRRDIARRIDRLLARERNRAAWDAWYMRGRYENTRKHGPQSGVLQEMAMEKKYGPRPRSKR